MPSPPRPAGRLPRGRYNEIALKQDNSSGYAALRHGAGLIDRRRTGRILLTGVDRRSYLQGLLTNDIEALTPGTGCYAAMLTALSEDVQVEDVTAVRGEIGIYGPGALDVVVKAGMEGVAPASVFATTRVRFAGADAVLVRSDEASVAGYDIIVETPHMEPVTAALAAAGAVRVSESDAEAVRIESGRPRFGVDMNEDTIPLEAGLEARAISRSKGCYVGQEVIVRVQDRGHGRVAKRLVGLTFDADAQPPAPGAPIVSGDREIGRVTSATWSPALARPIALGYVHRDFVEPGTQVAVEAVAAVVTALPLVAAG